jgi:hypothetical protein
MLQALQWLKGHTDGDPATMKSHCAMHHITSDTEESHHKDGIIRNKESRHEVILGESG